MGRGWTPCLCFGPTVRPQLYSSGPTDRVSSGESPKLCEPHPLICDVPIYLLWRWLRIHLAGTRQVRAAAVVEEGLGVRARKSSACLFPLIPSGQQGPLQAARVKPREGVAFTMRKLRLRAHRHLPSLPASPRQSPRSTPCLLPSAPHPARVGSTGDILPLGWLSVKWVQSGSAVCASQVLRTRSACAGPQGVQGRPLLVLPGVALGPGHWPTPSTPD